MRNAYRRTDDPPITGCGFYFALAVVILGLLAWAALAVVIALHL